MGRKYLKLLFVIVMSVFLIGGAAQQAVAQQAGSGFQVYDLNPEVKSGKFVKKVETFLVIIDASESMAWPYKGQQKLNIATEFVSRMNQTIPDLQMAGALRVFGQGFLPIKRRNLLVYGLAEYSKEGFSNGLKTIKGPGGRSPLEGAIDAASDDLDLVEGNIAVIAVSDGEQMDEAPVMAARKMKERYGDSICIYTVLVGNSPSGKKVLEQVARAGKCGFAVEADKIASGRDMADFVKKIFLTSRPDSDGDGVYDDMDMCPNTPGGVKVDSKGCPLDSDGDGVYDYLDQCPNTPKGVKVDAKGCPLDSDGDGVFDDVDECPNTPKGISVDVKGCSLDTDGDGVYDHKDKCPGTPKGARVDERGCWVLAGVMFDTARSKIKHQYYVDLAEVIFILQRNPSLKLAIEGHTDNSGTEDYNLKLSEKRARAVMEHLVRGGIDASRLSPREYGYFQPIASNDTPEGMAKNRRVELTPNR